jgi:hypothetical protein
MQVRQHRGVRVSGSGVLTEGLRWSSAARSGLELFRGMFLARGCACRGNSACEVVKAFSVSSGDGPSCRRSLPCLDQTRGR